MLIYILDNEANAFSSDNADKVYYNAGEYDLIEEAMSGQMYFECQGQRLTLVGLVEDHYDKDVNIYSSNQDEYDWIIETISVTEPEDLEPSYYFHEGSEKVYFKTEEDLFGYYTDNGTKIEYDTQANLIAHLDSL